MARVSDVDANEVRAVAIGVVTARAGAGSAGLGDDDARASARGCTTLYKRALRAARAAAQRRGRFGGAVVVAGRPASGRGSRPCSARRHRLDGVNTRTTQVRRSLRAQP